MATTITEKSYAVEARYSNFYAGGDVCWSTDGKRMYCLNTTEVCVVEVATGQVVQSFGTKSSSTVKSTVANVKTEEPDEDEDIIYAFALATSGDLLATTHRSGLLRLWSLETGEIVKLWKAQHKGPVVKIVFSSCDKFLCSSGADSTLRVWDFVNSHCVGVLKDFTGPSLVLTFHPYATKAELYAVGADNTIYCWNFQTKQLINKMRGHLSQVTGLSFIDDSKGRQLMASVSRDKVLIVWQLSDGAQQKVIPMYDELEGVCAVQGTCELIVACLKGKLKLVNFSSGKISSLIESADYEIKFLLHCKQIDQLAVVTVEHNILIYNMLERNRLDCGKQLIGFNDELLDLCFLGENERYLAVATNSKNFKVYDTEDQMNCKIIAGHKDIVMTLASAGKSNLLLSSGKDFSIFLWELNSDDFTLSCIAKQHDTHTSTIGCITFGYNITSTFASVSQDGSLKVWTLQKDKTLTYHFNIKYSVISHAKDVNCVAFSPNNKILATASQDKTVKLWSSEVQSIVGTLRGHSRGVWCVRFSPVDQIVLTTSGDGSLRIWSLSSMSCLKRFEQDCSVLRAEFVDNGKFIISAASDGLIKLWNIKTNACVQTLDEHTDRVWSLAVSALSKMYFYSGGADSKLVKWRDITEQSRSVEIDKRQATLLQEQTLQSLLHQQQHMEKAFLLALTLSKPKVSYNILNYYVRRRDLSAVKNTIAQLNVNQRAELLQHVKAWSTNSRHCKVSNLVLRHILSDILANSNERSYNTTNLVEVLTPYVQRHFNRMTELSKELMFLEFLVKCI